MTRFLLDTNIISNITKPIPSPLLLTWMGAQDDNNLFISSLTIAEIRRGIFELQSGKKRDQLDVWFDGKLGPSALFAGRVLPFDEDAALVWAQFMADGKRLGRPRSAIDMMVAAIATVNNCLVVTDNEWDFEGIKILNPLRL